MSMTAKTIAAKLASCSCVWHTGISTIYGDDLPRPNDEHVRIQSADAVCGSLLFFFDNGSLVTMLHPEGLSCSPNGFTILSAECIRVESFKNPDVVFLWEYRSEPETLYRSIDGVAFFAHGQKGPAFSFLEVAG